MADLLLYDGVCGLCNRLVQFVLARDLGARFRFAALQGAVAQEHLLRFDRRADDLDTVYVVVDFDGAKPRLLYKGRAIAWVLRSLGGGWRIVGWLLALVPRALADFGYDQVARRRYRWFGRSATCVVPQASASGRFLDDYSS